MRVDGDRLTALSRVPGTSDSLPDSGFHRPPYAQAPDETPIRLHRGRLQRCARDARRYVDMPLADQPPGFKYAVVWSETFGSFLLGASEGLYRLDHRTNPAVASLI